MHAIAGLGNDGALRAVDNFIGDFFAAAGGQAMHDAGFGWRVTHEVAVELNWAKMDLRSAASCSCPMLVQTSVYTKSASAKAILGSTDCSISA